MKGKLATLATLIAGAIILLVSPAQAAPGDSIWKPMSDGAKIVGPHVVKMTDGSTSVEAENLGMDLPYGAPVSFKFELGPGVTCGGGAPRVFLKVNGGYYNSFDLNPDQCGGEDGKVTFIVPAAGEATHAGVVFDNGQQGWLKVKNLKVNGVLIDFTATEPEVEPEPTATANPEPSASASCNPAYSGVCLVGDDVDCSEIDDTDKPVDLVTPGDDPYKLDQDGDGQACEASEATKSPIAGSAGGSGDGQSLPITGVNVGLLALAGAAIVAAGVAMKVLGRKRKIRTTA